MPPAVPPSRATLVVGADGLVGRELFASLARSGRPTLGTTRRTSPGPAFLRLDLGAEPATWDIPPALDVAIICAGVTKIEACRTAPETAWLINVERTALLSQRLAAQGCFVIFLSTNRVFDGLSPMVPAQTPPNPVTEYGRCKAAAEARILALAEMSAVVRLTKVVAPGDPLFTNWANTLRKRAPIRPFHDVVLSPVPLATVVHLLRLVGETRGSGLWQISGELDVTYAQAAAWGAEALGADPGLVHPWSYRDAGLHPEFALNHSTLDGSRLWREFGLTPPPSRWTIVNAFRSTAPDQD